MLAAVFLQAPCLQKFLLGKFSICKHDIKIIAQQFLAALYEK